MFDQFLQERVYLKGISTETQRYYKWVRRAFEPILDNPTKSGALQCITKLRDKGVKPISVNSYLCGFNAYLRWLHVEVGKELIVIPRLREETKILATLSADHISALIRYKAVGTNLLRAWMVALVVLDCGLRISETLSLRKEHVKLEELSILVFGKGGKYRLVPISKELRSRLFRNMTGDKQDYLFPTRTGGKVSVRNIERDLKTLFKRIGIEGVRASPHTLRHTFAVCYLRNGGNLEFLRRILGHTSLTTTQKYLKSLGVEDLGAVHNSLSPLSRR